MNNTPAKVEAFSGTINRSRLYEELAKQLPNSGITSGKIPRYLVETIHTRLPVNWSRADYYEGTHKVTIRQSPTLHGSKRGTPRVFVHCACGKHIPAGRVNQHLHDARFGTVRIDFSTI